MEHSKTTQLYDKQKAIGFYERRYVQGYMEEWPAEAKHKVIEVIRGLGLPECGEALDFGCGNGVLTEVIRQALPKWKVYGTDISTIAIAEARKRYPNCTFFVVGEKAFAGKKFDFVFTNHVLEHVYNLPQVLDEIDNRLKPTARILHILPSGNEGSFEHNVCLLRKDGINRELENRFFFEDEAHVRRLNTEQMSKLYAEKGFMLAREYYSCQYYGAIDWITQQGIGFVWMLTDTSEAIDETAKEKLRKLRYYLSFIAAIRFFAVKFENVWRKRKKRIKHFVFLIAGLPSYIVAKPIDVYWKRKAFREWKTRKMDRNGSEMLLYFTRQR